MTTHATGPHEQAKKKISREKAPFRQHRVNRVREEEKEENPPDSLLFFSFFFLLAKESGKSDLKTYKYKQKQSQHAAQQYYPPKPPSP